MAATSRTQMTSSLKCRNWSAQLCQSVYTLVDSDTQTEFYPITDVQPVKKMAPHVCEIMVKLPSVGDESSGSIHYPLQFLCCRLWQTSHHQVE